jgi:hypothetical protein
MMTLDAYKALVEEHFHDIENAINTPWRLRVGPNNYVESCGCFYSSNGKLIQSCGRPNLDGDAPRELLPSPWDTF